MSSELVKADPITFRLDELSDPVKKTLPACCCCGYDATHIIAVGKLERFFCENDLMNALFDAINYAEAERG